MLFPIDYINHDIEKVHEIPHHFFTELQKGEITTFCEELFPQWLRGKHFRGKIKAEFEKLYELIQKLLPQERSALYQAFFDGNKIENLCSNITLKNKSIVDLPLTIQRQIKDLFVWLYSYILTHKKSPIPRLLNTTIKKHFQEYENANKTRICPFCGIEYLNLLESEGRTAYDHYLPKSKYAFSTINMHNLIPIGTNCNEKKKDKDILYDENDRRTYSFYPFKFNKKYAKDYYFKLNYNEYPSEKNSFQGIWKVDILPINPNDSILQQQLISWRRIFNIDERYAELVAKSHKAWLKPILQKYSSLTENLEQKINKKFDDEIERNEPNINNLKSETNILPRFLYFNFLNNDEDLRQSLINFIIQRPTETNQDDLELD